MPTFESWSQENLAKFAQEAYIKLQEQQNHIEQLQNDLKDAISRADTECLKHLRIITLCANFCNVQYEMNH